MGYSCTKDAADTLAVIEHTFRVKDGHVLTIRGTDHFFERGREQTDGAITGKLMEMLPDDYCRSVGTVRIEPDGTITRFPRLKVMETVKAEETMRHMQVDNPALLSQWGYGVL